MAITPDNDRPKRNDLPARAAKRITAILFPNVPLPPSELTTAFRYRLEQDITRAIWDEMVVLEGEMSLYQKKGVPE